MVDGGAAASVEGRLDGGHARLLVVDLGVDLAGRHVARVLRQQRGQRTYLAPQCGECVQRREHPRVRAPEVPEIEVAGVLAAEDCTGLGHRRLDERVTDPGADGRATSLDRKSVV